jgi:hypothetical protein
MGMALDLPGSWSVEGTIAGFIEEEAADICEGTPVG